MKFISVINEAISTGTVKCDILFSRAHSKEYTTLLKFSVKMEDMKRHNAAPYVGGNQEI